MSLRHTRESEPAQFGSASPPDAEDSFPATETLQLVANETRQRILHVLHAALDSPLEFSTLRERCDVDQSARFNYHLQELVGELVHETTDGYTLCSRGEGFVSALYAAPSVDESRGRRSPSPD